MTYAPEPYYTPGWTAQNRHQTSITSAPVIHYGLMVGPVEVIEDKPPAKRKPRSRSSARRRS